MITNMLKPHFAIIFMAICGVCHGQYNSADSHLAAPASKSNNIEFSLFTGNVNYTIPIYTLDDPDFPLNIALRYQSDGFKPLQSSGCYGQNWSLSAGGAITRIVQGFPDEQLIEYKNPYFLNGIFIGMHYAFADGWKPDKNMVFNMQLPAYNSLGVRFPWVDMNDTVWLEMDYMPDIYSFSFMGYHGRFIINNQGTPIILSGDFVNIDMSRLHERYMNNNYGNRNHQPHGDSLQITISTLDGYRYTFGGSAEAVEYSVLSDKTYQEVPSISTWHLSSITAPNGRTMSFEYVKDNGNMLRYFTMDYDWAGKYVSDLDSSNIIHVLQKKSLLHSISTSDSVRVNISFYSSEEEYKMFQNENLPYCHKNLQLDSIVVNYGDRVLASARLNYISRFYNDIYGIQTNYYWRYLSSIQISGRGRYSFSYNYIDPYPASAPVYFHFFKYPDLYVTTNAEYENLVDRFGFWKQSSVQGLLSDISFPTGGKIHFTYENHQYGEERKFQIIGSSDVELISHYTQNMTIGGARIEKIETFSNNNSLVETKTYSYYKPGTTNSSGIFYNIYNVFDSSNSESGHMISNPDNYGLVDSHIGYSYVQCMTNTGNETYKTIYTFDTGHGIYSSVNNTAIHRNTNLSSYADSVELRSGSLTYSPQLIQTGKLLAVEQYQGNTIQKATYYRYNGISNTATNLPVYDGASIGCIDTIVCLSSFSGHIARKLFIYPNVLEQSVSYEYSPNSNVQPMISSISYTLDSKFRNKEIKTIDSRGITHFTRYTYPDDLACVGFISPYELLVNSNRIGTPLEVVSGYKDGNVDKFTSGTVNLYATGNYVVIRNNKYLPSSPRNFPDSLIYQFEDSIPIPPVTLDSIESGEMKYYPYLFQTKSLAIGNPITDYSPLTGNNASVSYDSRYRLTCEYLFDFRNRPLLVKPFGKIPTTYIWNSIEDLYPSAKKIGNQTWIYTFIPYIGVRSVTDPRGITTFYSYDAAGRLVEEYQIVNGKKQILNFYHHHIKTE